MQPNDTRLNVGKGAWTGDPAAGYDVVFHVSACNNGGTSSSQVTITDTLHLSMTLQTWWSDSPGWIEVVPTDPQQLVVTQLSLAAGAVRASTSAPRWTQMPGRACRSGTRPSSTPPTT